MNRFFGKIMLLPLLVLLSFLSSCTNNSDPASPSDQNTAGNTAYVYLISNSGIYYWSDSKATLLVPANGNYGSLRLSPDGKWVMFADIVNHENIIKVVKTNGDSLHAVFSGRHFPYEYHAEWAPGGRHIMIGDTSEIFVTSFPADVSESFAIGSQGVYPHNYTWNSKGNKIFLTSPYQLNYPWYQGIYSIDLNTKQIDTVLKTQMLTLCDFSCSADDGSLAFTALLEETGSSNLTSKTQIINLNDKTITQLTSSEGRDFSPVWSPADPGLLAYLGYEGNTINRLVYVYNTETNTRRALTTDMQFPDGKPVWSNDGKRILFLDGNHNKWNYVDVSSGTITPIDLSLTGIDW